MTATTATRPTTTEHVVALAAAAGLRPIVTAPYGNSYEVAVNGTGPDAIYGAVVFGRRTGRIVRATLTYGANPRTCLTRRYEGHAAVMAVLRRLV